MPTCGWMDWNTTQHCKRNKMLIFETAEWVNYKKIKCVKEFDKN